MAIFYSLRDNEGFLNLIKGKEPGVYQDSWKNRKLGRVGKFYTKNKRKKEEYSVDELKWQNFIKENLKRGSSVSVMDGEKVITGYVKSIKENGFELIDRSGRRSVKNFPYSNILSFKPNYSEYIKYSKYDAHFKKEK